MRSDGDMNQIGGNGRYRVEQGARQRSHLELSGAIWSYLSDLDKPEIRAEIQSMTMHYFVALRRASLVHVSWRARVPRCRLEWRGRLEAPGPVPNHRH